MRLPVIGLLGLSGSGKTTVGDLLCEKGNGVPIALADPLKKIVSTVFHLSDDALYTVKGKEAPTQYSCARCPTCSSLNVTIEVVDHEKRGNCKLCGCNGEAGVFLAKKWTPRMILQHVGTEGFRAVDETVWARLAIQEAKKILADPTKFVVITDVRFRTECEAIWREGGEVWRISRPSNKDEAGLKGHASETEQLEIQDNECQAVIVNDSTLDTLKGRVASQLNRFMGSFVV